jgi:hypothetical protein
MTNILQLGVWLAEAKLARHKLLTGSKEQSVSYGGKAVSFSQADAYQLDAYIADLERQIAEANGKPARRGPVQFVF